MSAFPSISPASLFGLGSITQVSSRFPTAVPGLTAGLSAFNSTSTIVELSGLGQLLSAVSTFQTNLSALQPGSANSGIGQNFGTDFGSLAAEAQNFVDTFNGLQSSINNLQGPFGTLPGDPLAGQFAEALNHQATAAFDNGNSNLQKLAQIGINFQAPVISGNGGTLSIDLKTLQSAFNSEQAGTFSLLAQTVQSFDKLAEGFAGQTAKQATTVGGLAQIGAATQSLNLFSNLLTGSGSSSGLPGVADLLLLASLTQSGGTSQLQQLLAVNQFALVSSLLG